MASHHLTRDGNERLIKTSMRLHRHCLTSLISRDPILGGPPLLLIQMVSFEVGTLPEFAVLTLSKILEGSQLGVFFWATGSEKGVFLGSDGLFRVSRRICHSLELSISRSVATSYRVIAKYSVKRSAAVGYLTHYHEEGEETMPSLDIVNLYRGDRPFAKSTDNAGNLRI